MSDLSENPPASRKPRPQSEEDEEGEASDVSLGSGAMSESESEDEVMPTPIVSKDIDEPLYPLEGKFRSEEDRRAVLAMPELQREEVLADRAKEVEEQRFRAQLRQRTQAQTASKDSNKRKAAVADLDDSPRKANKAKTQRGDALEQLKRSRAEKGQRRKSPSAASRRRSTTEEESDFDYDDEPRRKSAPKPPVNDVPASVSAISHITLIRDDVAKLCLTPGFEDVATGCFVRICTGPDPKMSGALGYRYVQIKSFTVGKPYSMPLPGSNRPIWTDAYLQVTPGLHDQKYPFTQVSNSTFSEAEYHEFQLRMSDSKLKYPTQSFCAGKEAALLKLSGHTWTDFEINEKVKRQELLSDPTYTSRINLNAARRQAEMDDDKSEMARIDQELAELNEKPTNRSAAAKARDAEQERLANISRRNRKANFEQTRYLQSTSRKEQKELQRKIERGEAKPDPMARKPMFAKTFVDANEEDKKRRPKQGDKLAVPGKDKELDDLFGGSEAGGSSRAPSPAPVPKRTLRPGRRQPMTDDDVIAALDMELDIDI